MESQEGIKQIPCMEIWDHLCLPKSKSGIGFRKSKMFNNALIAKLTWMVLTNHDSLCVHNDWLGKDPCKFASGTWRAIKHLKTLVAKGVCYLVEDVDLIDIWKICY